MRNLRTTEVRHTEHRVVLAECELKAVIIEAVAKAAGVDLDQPGVRVDTFHITTVDRGSAGMEKQAKVVIIVDHAPEPVAST